MDDPTRRCENDTGIGTRLPGLPIPSGGPTFFERSFGLSSADNPGRSEVRPLQEFASAHFLGLASYFFPALFSDHKNSSYELKLARQ